MQSLVFRRCIIYLPFVGVDRKDLQGVYDNAKRYYNCIISVAGTTAL